MISATGAATIPGMEVGVWVPGEGSFVRAFGTSGLKGSAKLQLGDHFRIASISKSFTAVAILRLVDQGKLALADHLGSFVAGIPHGEEITVAQLLDMTSGIYDYTADSEVVRKYTENPLMPFASSDVVRIIGEHAPLFAPGADVAYDNSNYYLLGMVVEAVTHVPLGEVIKSEILDPLGMRHTSYPTTAALPTPFSHGFLSEPNLGLRDVTESNPAFAGGAGAMISTLGDLKIWAKALATGSLLTPATHIEQLKTHELSRTPKISVGYGMGITRINGLLGHDGAILGYGSAMFYLPSKHATIVLLGSNNDLGSPAPLAPAIAIAAYLFPRQFPAGI